MQLVILFLHLSSKELGIRYKFPSREEILTMKQYKYTKKDRVMKRGKLLLLIH